MDSNFKLSQAWLAVVGFSSDSSSRSRPLEVRGGEEEGREVRAAQSC